jgi:uncharacterized protein YbbC (DUF1343 family)
MRQLLSLLVCLSMIFTLACAGPANDQQDAGIKSEGSIETAPEKNGHAKIVPAAERMELYLPLLRNKRVAVFANHTSMVGATNLVDTLVKSGIKVTVIFGPEHGFRGTADAGEKVGNYTDEQTGVPVISLYGSKRKPSREDLRDVDVMLFDIQDVGTRFYTYISSLEEYMEAALENNKPLIILDRPNPNGFYVDGPVLDTNFRSFVGMQPVPIVYGLTIGEYAWMLVGEKWLQKGLAEKALDAPANDSALAGPATSDSVVQIGKKGWLTIVKCAGYDHNSKYELPVRPSPNLPDMQSIYLYPSTCLFEGTVLSEGRGTDKPFQVFGHPLLPPNFYSFTPRSIPGATNPKFKDQVCYGWDLSGTTEEVLTRVDNRVQLKWLIEAYRLFPQKDSFFLRNGGFFNKLAGNDVLIKQIRERVSEGDIRKSWEPALNTYKGIRKKYLLYKDFD